MEFLFILFRPSFRINTNIGQLTKLEKKSVYYVSQMKKRAIKLREFLKKNINELFYLDMNFKI